MALKTATKEPLLEEEWKRFKFGGRIVTSQMITLLTWNDYDTFVYELFCRHFKTFPERAYDSSKRSAYTIALLPVLSHQEVVLRVIDKVTERDFLKFKEKYDVTYKLFYVCRSFQDSFRKGALEKTGFFIKDLPRIEILQPHILLQRQL